MIHQLLVKMYATNITTYGNRNFGTIPENYVQPVKEYIALNYTDWQIDNALVQDYITEQEYTEIMTLRNTK